MSRQEQAPRPMKKKIESQAWPTSMVRGGSPSRPRGCCGELRRVSRSGSAELAESFALTLPGVSSVGPASLAAAVRLEYINNISFPFKQGHDQDDHEEE